MRVEIIKVLDRALAVLGLLAMNQDGLTLAEVSARLKMPKSTTRRFLLTLVRRGFVEPEPSTERYRLGTALLSVATATRRENHLAALAQPVLDRLSREVGETANLNVRFGDVRICLAQSEGPARLRYVQEIGESAPLYAGAQGKLLLAAFAQAELDEYLSRTFLEPLARNTITDPDALRAELARIRTRRYAAASGELTPDASAIAAGVLDRTGRVVASIGVAGPAVRLTKARLAQLAPQIIEAANEISRKLGFRASSTELPKAENSIEEVQ